MKKNFRIEDYVTVDIGGDKFDIHNDFDLLGMEVNYQDRSTVLTWREAILEINVQARCLRFVFSETQFVSIMIVGKADQRDSRVLAAAGYLPESESKYSDRFYPEEDRRDSDAVTFLFEDGSIVTIGSRSAIATVDS